MNITLRQLEVFCAIARRSNVSRAAEEVAISQSAASMALAELERQLGAKLFDRLGKKLVLNANGQLLFPKASDLMARAGELERLFEAENAGRNCWAVFPTPVRMCTSPCRWATPNRSSSRWLNVISTLVLSRDCATTLISNRGNGGATN